ncbi:hypothetical protein OIO90_005250 [Microbotryomycetes sp. JL221]|nr:hypothetical protein OIO90_005250 [Microbotryomycetes sp. JL221]
MTLRANNAPHSTDAVAVALRSGFYALPLDHGTEYLAARQHKLVLEEGEQIDQERLLVTNLPPATNEGQVKRLFTKICKTSVSQVDMVSSGNDSGRFGAATLLGRDLVVAQAKPDVQQAFASTSKVQISNVQSCIVTFETSIAWPPSSYSSSLALPSRKQLQSEPSYLTVSARRHNLGRPHSLIITAHTDTWMNGFDKRKLPNKNDRNLAEAVGETASMMTARQKKQQRKATAQQQATAPGSAAAALAAYAATQAKLADKNHNPDEPEEEGWTLVTRGGKHGKSMLPAGAVPSLSGYGATTFRVGKASVVKRPGVESDASDDDEDDNRDHGSRELKKGKAKYESGVRKTVGSGFYRVTKQAERKKELEKLKQRFEEDKAKLGRGRGSGAHRRSDSKSKRSFKPY